MKFRVYESPILFAMLSEDWKLPVAPMLKKYYVTEIEADNFRSAVQKYFNPWDYPLSDED